jgi:hypothetical protein
MLDDFVDTETLTSQQMTRHSMSSGKRYGFGWFIGRDGMDHCGIDSEPLLTRYKHGVNYKSGHLATAAEVGNWQYF